MADKTKTETIIPSAVPRTKAYLDPARWGELEDQSASGSIIKTQSVCQMIEEKMPGFRCGVWDDEDLHYKIRDGWEVVTPEHWKEVEDWNETVASRHGIAVQDGGLLLPNHGWICIMPKDLQYRRWKRQREREEARIVQTFKAVQSNVPPEAKAEGKLEIKMTRAGQRDADVASMLNEQGAGPAE